MTTVWRLKSKEDRRFRGGHPWVYSNELQGSPKGLAPGAPVELCDAGGNFLARGYGNPASLIAFRALSRNSGEAEPHRPAAVREKLRSALGLRKQLGLVAPKASGPGAPKASDGNDASFRLCHGEADELPGLIIDCYRLDSGARVFAVQAHTAGADQWMPAIEEILAPLAAEELGVSGDAFGVVLRNDLPIRKLEGLTEEEPRRLRGPSEEALARAHLRVRSAVPGAKPVSFFADLLEGQKTGFFLDQGANVALAIDRVRGLRPAKGDRLRVLDLCCYVGQWGTQLAAAFGGKVDVLAVDASERALELARANVESQPGAKFEALRGDALHDLGPLEAGRFDLVISDPPGLIKSRRDQPQGKHAYLQLNTQAMRVLRPGGALVTCSCSALFEEEEFLSTLTKAAQRGNRVIRWVARGAQGPDHPMLTAFPEGRYLKCWIGWG